MSERSNATLFKQHKDVNDTLDIVEQQLDFLIEEANKEQCEGLEASYHPIKSNVLLAKLDMRKLCGDLTE